MPSLDGMFSGEGPAGICKGWSRAGALSCLLQVGQESSCSSGEFLRLPLQPFLV